VTAAASRTRVVESLAPPRLRDLQLHA